VRDVAEAVVLAAKCLMNWEHSEAPIHLVSGHSTSLLELARLVLELSGSTSRIVYGNPRNFDVSSFSGSPNKSRRVLNWTHKTALRTGIAELIGSFERSLRLAERSN
jgi:nucleoside-diphosphate-sugar epimerase